MTLAERQQAIVDEMRQFGGIVVAFSGGVDSSVVASLAHEALGSGALAVTAVSETLGARELEDAKRIASEIGIQHEFIEFSELSDDRFVENTSSRCFFCQSMRFDQLRALAEQLDCEILASGTNLDDTADHRPGLKAMAQRRVYQPLLEHRVTKHEVRQIARSAGLSVWDKPAKACLSSRIPHGLSVTSERLRRIERAEDALEDLGFHHLRVRDHHGLARVEVSTVEQQRLLDKWARVRDALRTAGFEQSSIDLIGYAAGSLNE